jgi:hypothetical protein
MNKFYKTKAYVTNKYSLSSDSLDLYLSQNPDVIIKTEAGEYINIGLKKFREWAGGKKASSKNNQLELKAIKADTQKNNVQR